MAEIEAQKAALAGSGQATREREKELAAKLAGIAQAEKAVQAAEQAAAERVRARQRELAAEEKELVRRREELGETEKLQAHVREELRGARREATRSAERQAALEQELAGVRRELEKHPPRRPGQRATSRPTARGWPGNASGWRAPPASSSGRRSRSAERGTTTPRPGPPSRRR